ncbi:DUF1080 domain-containing protein [Planctomicrobium sp.]|nr:DUF1080 domain-containing protein [Planctomicrobium sp.]MDB4732961.1 DUF1080 domain-containing protein [Planctomicrobium sp.]
MNLVFRSAFFLTLCSFTILGCQQENPTNSQTEPKITENETVDPKLEESTSQEKHPDEKLVEETNNAELETAFKYLNPLSKEEQADGWLSLFDGQSLFGWESTNEEINWSVAEGNIVADSGPIGFLMTTVPFKDYELVCEYKMEADGNSGLFLRSEFPPGDIANECYEVNIAATHPDGFTTGSLVNRLKTDEPVEMKEGWNELRMTLDGDKAQVAHNGKVVLEYTAKDNIAATGRIGLQKNKGKIEFRKIVLKPLNMKSLFNGKDLAGWRDVPGTKSEFKVENEEIHVSNGLGFIETEETFQNFIFQAQAISHEKELNSGFFFRAMPGTEEAPSNGYEFQIHNGFNEERTAPNNAGTGAIFRRVEARYVVANDKEWFTSTLIANGPRIACWVDGYQVVDWLDERKADPNPRRGLRLEGGHISIQGHDPTTDLSFKNLNFAEFE